MYSSAAPCGWVRWFAARTVSRSVQLAGNDRVRGKRELPSYHHSGFQLRLRATFVMIDDKISGVHCFLFIGHGHLIVKAHGAPTNKRRHGNALRLPARRHGTSRVPPAQL